MSELEMESEGLLFSVAVLVLVVEYTRQKGNENIKQQKEKDYLTSLENQISDLTFANEELDTRIRELTRIVYAVKSQHEERKNETDTNKKNTSAGKLLNAIEAVQSHIKKS